MVKIGFIGCYLDKWHTNNYPAWLKWCKDMDLPQVKSIQQVLEEFDSNIKLSPDDYQLHEGAVRFAPEKRQASICG